MKRLLVFCLLLLTAKAYSQDYMDKIVNESCNCITKVSDTLQGERLALQFGMCMINAAEPYRKELKKDYDIDMNKIDKQGEKLGKIIGLRMASVCPDGLLAMSERIKGKVGSKNADKDFDGKVVKIEKENFVIFSIEDEAGKLLKFYWLGFIEADGNLIADYNALVGKEVSVSYKSEELFDPKINEYRQFNIIKELKKAD